MGTIVVDTNVVLATVVDLPFTELAERRWGEWIESETEIVVPALFHYETASALRHLIAQKEITAARAEEALVAIDGLGLRVQMPTPDLNQAALRWADRFGKHNAYDAAFVALAEQQGVELWTADEPLANRAKQLKVKWVHWIGEPDGE